jgi:hypothetical protein
MDAPVFPISFVPTAIKRPHALLHLAWDTDLNHKLSMYNGNVKFAYYYNAETESPPVQLQTPTLRTL